MNTHKSTDNAPNSIPGDPLEILFGGKGLVVILAFGLLLTANWILFVNPENERDAERSEAAEQAKVEARAADVAVLGALLDEVGPWSSDDRALWRETFSRVEAGTLSLADQLELPWRIQYALGEPEDPR